MNLELTTTQFLTQILPHFSTLLDVSQSFIHIITTTVDIIAITIAAISIFQAIFSSFSSVMKSFFDVHAAFRFTKRNAGYTLPSLSHMKLKKNLISGLLFALELESANAILKLGLFTSTITGAQIATTA